MAACASSSIADEALCATDKKENFQRLAGLLMCGGVTLLREMFDTIHPPANLPVKLNDPATKTQLKGAKLSKPEWDCVYPSPGMCGKSTDFDITLLFRLLRTICCLTHPATGWDKLPINADHSREADLARIKYYRNSVYGHNRTMEITDSDFANLWREISEALLRIAGTISTAKRDEWKESINKLFHDPLTPDAARYVAELQSWYKKDIDTKDEVEKLGNTIMEQLIIMNDKHDKQEQITMLNTKLQELTIKHNILLEHVISIRTTIESTKPGGSSITQSQFPNTPLVQQPGLQSESACIPGPTGMPPEQPQTEGAFGTSSSWELQQNDPTDLDIWQVILSSCNFPLLFEKLRMKFSVDVQSSRLGSLVITVSCSSLEVLEGLWKDHCTGHLNEMVQETLVTAEVLQELCLSEVKLKTIISEKEYKACKELFTQGNENLQQLCAEETNTRETPSITTTTSTSDDSDENESLKIQEATSQGVVVVPPSLDNRPVSDTVLHDIGSGLGTSWKELGRCLGIPEKDLKAIDMKEHDKEERKGILMLNMWKETRGEYATRVVLQEALEEIGRTDLSQKGETKTKIPHRPALVTKPATHDVSLTNFKAWMMYISNQLTSDDLDKMKFVLQYVLAERKLEGVQQPYQLFSLMMEAKLLSANNLTRLVELLKVVGRVDLSKYLMLEVEGETKTKIPHRPALVTKPATHGDTKTKMPHRPAAAMAAEPSAYVPRMMMELTSLDRPVSDTLLHELTVGLGTSWKTLGRHLRIPEYDLTYIDEENRRVEEKYAAVFDVWKRRWGDEATESVLREALEKTRRSNLLEIVQGETKTKMPHRPAAARAAEPAAYDEPLQFEEHLMFISNQLTSDDLNKMKFDLRDDLPKRKLEEVQRPYQLFSLMMEAKLLSANNLTRLVELLEVVGRVDLSKYALLEVVEQTRYVKHSAIPKGETYIAESGYVMMMNNYSPFLQSRAEFHTMSGQDYLKQLFQFKFGFRLGEHKNLTKSEMLKELTHTAEKDFSAYDCFVCVIQCQGSKDGIFGIDDEVIKPETIVSLFTRDKCPSLDGKPKIFLIQVRERHQTDKEPGSGPPPCPVHSFEDDFLIWYAPLYDPRLSFETPLLSLAYSLKEYSSSRDLMEILMRVNKRAESNFQIPPSSLVSTLTKKVFLERK